MTMEYFSGFEEEPAESSEPQPALNTSTPETHNDSPDSQFERDVADYLAARERLLEEDIEGTVPPPLATWRTNLSKDPFSYFYMQNTAIKRRGYGIHFINNAVDRHERPITDHSVAMYVDDDDKQSVNDITSTYFEIQYSDNRPPFAEFLHKVTDKLIGRHTLNPAHRQYGEVRQSLAQVEGSQDIERLVVQGFLTSVVLGKVQDLTTPGDVYSWRVQPGDEELYVELSSQGIRPFSPEQLYGMAASVINFVMRVNPDIPPPASRRRQKPEY